MPVTTLTFNTVLGSSRLSLNSNFLDSLRQPDRKLTMYKDLLGEHVDVTVIFEKTCELFCYILYTNVKRLNKYLPKNVHFNLIFFVLVSEELSSAVRL